MYEFHGDKRRYFDMTLSVTRKHIIPFIQERWTFPEGMEVLEIGCGEAGVLKAFNDLGYSCTGIELEDARLDHARAFMAEELKRGAVQFLNKDIYDTDPEHDLGRRFDLIILKDVIEHIPDQARFMPQLHRFLKPGGVVFFAFPPWQMPYGGHQQVLPGKLASKIPWYHLLPGPFYRGLLKLFGVRPTGISTMMEIKSTGISIERFLRISRNTGFSVAHQRHYLFNPIYEHKFGIKPRRQWAIISALPVLRNFCTMGVYYLMKEQSTQ
jgi:SAM-dependent methyltransferase